MGNKKKKLKKKVGRKLSEGERAFVVCLGDKCAPRKEARAVVDEARAYLARELAAGHDEAGKVRVEMFGCLGICEKGPIAATLPKAHLFKHVDGAKAHEIVDTLMKKVRRAREKSVAAAPSATSATSVGVVEAKTAEA